MFWRSIERCPALSGGKDNISRPPFASKTPKFLGGLGFIAPPVGCIAHGCAFGSMLHSALRQGAVCLFYNCLHKDDEKNDKR